MSEDIFKKFDKSVDLKGLTKDIEDAKKNGGNRDYEDVPEGNYEIKIDKMELTESKKHDPMFTCWMVILNGKYKNQRLFMNQVITQGFQIHIVNEFLRSLLDEGADFDVEFTEDGGYTGYYDLIMDIFEYISDNLEYEVKFYKNNKGYNCYEIKNIYGD